MAAMVKQMNDRMVMLENTVAKQNRMINDMMENRKQRKEEFQECKDLHNHLRNCQICPNLEETCGFEGFIRE